jgi:hypothetical protein
VKLFGVNLYCSNATFEGRLNLTGAKINGNLDFTDARLNNPDNDILVGRRCQVGGVLYFRLAERAIGKVNLAYAQVDPLVDNVASWPDTLNLVGFSYRSIDSEDRFDLDQRLTWLHRSKPFSPAECC